MRGEGIAAHSKRFPENGTEIGSIFVETRSSPYLFVTTRGSILRVSQRVGATFSVVTLPRAPSERRELSSVGDLLEWRLISVARETLQHLCSNETDYQVTGIGEPSSTACNMYKPACDL